MTMSYAAAVAKLDAELNGATPYVMLHIGDPGAAGTANEAQISAADIDRKAATFAAAGPHAVNDEACAVTSADIDWSGAEIDASQEITHFSVWSAETAGNCLHIDEITTPKTTGSDGVTIGTGDLEVAISVYAKPA